MKTVKVAFLDRDGVLNSNKYNNGYIGLLKHFRWIQGAKKSIKYLKKKKFKVVVVTNQSGVARGYFKMKDVRNIHTHMQKKLKVVNTKIDKFYFCPYHKDGIVKRYAKSSLLRKPNIGMFKEVKKLWKIDLKNSFMIGDQKTDMTFAKKAKINGYFFDQKNLFEFIKKLKLK